MLASAQAQVVAPSLIVDQGASTETSDAFGTAVANGDFNGDGFEDLAVGAPGKNVHDVADSGAVFVYYGSANGLETGVVEILTQTDHVPNHTSESDDQFGWSLARGDFDRDGFDDLVIGSPFEDLLVDSVNVVDTGIVTIIYGSAAGLAASEVVESMSQTSLPSSFVEAGDHFGWSLGVGDIDGNFFDDLVVGVPQEHINGQNITDTGMIGIFYGSRNGLLPADAQEISQDDPTDSTNEDGDQMGWSIAVADFNGDSYADVAVGIPGKDIDFDDNAGLVAVFSGGTGGLDAEGAKFFSQEDLDGGSNEDEDQFGWSLAAGDFDGDGIDDLAVGSPFEDAGVRDNTGEVGVFYGDRDGLEMGSSEIFTQADAGEDNDREDGAGAALAVGDFDGDGFVDLLVGVPFKNDRSTADTGAALVFFGSGDGLVPAQSFLLTQEEFGGEQASRDEFGSVLAAGDFDGDGLAEMVFGVPSELAGGAENGGAVYVGTFADNDGDGLLDVVEIGLTGTDPALPDTDGDGVNDGDEIEAGTDPLDPRSLLAITSVVYNPATADVTIGWISGVGRSYFVEISTDLSDGSWQRLNGGNPIEAGMGNTTTFLDFTTSPLTTRRFYRVVLER